MPPGFLDMWVTPHMRSVMRQWQCRKTLWFAQRWCIGCAIDEDDSCRSDGLEDNQPLIGRVDMIKLDSCHSSCEPFPQVPGLF